MNNPIEEIVNDIPTKGKKWLLVLLISALIATSPVWSGYVLPYKVAQRVEVVAQQVDTLKKQFDRTSLEQNYRNERQERFMCYLNRKAALLAGLDCLRLIGTE